MRVLYLTDNPTLGGTIRILQGWLPLAPGEGISPFVVTPPGSKFLSWLADHGMPHATSPMTWPDRRWPVPAVRQAWALARWARRTGSTSSTATSTTSTRSPPCCAGSCPRPLVCHARYVVARGFCRVGVRRPSGRRTRSCGRPGSNRPTAPRPSRGRPRDRQQVVPLGLDLARFGAGRRARGHAGPRGASRPDEVVIGAGLRLRPRKRVEEFVDLVAELAREEPRGRRRARGGRGGGRRTVPGGDPRRVAAPGRAAGSAGWGTWTTSSRITRRSTCSSARASTRRSVTACARRWPAQARRRLPGRVDRGGGRRRGVGRPDRGPRGPDRGRP